MLTGSLQVLLAGVSWQVLVAGGDCWRPFLADVDRELHHLSSREAGWFCPS